MRSREQIDTFVRRVVELRLSQPDAVSLIAVDSSEELRDLTAAIEIERGKIARARSDYMAELIDGALYKETRSRAESEIASLESRRILLANNPALESLLNTSEPGKRFQEADLATIRQTIAGVMTVLLHPHPRGKRAFDPSTVEITWHSKDVAV